MDNLVNILYVVENIVGIRNDIVLYKSSFQKIIEISKMNVPFSVWI